MMYQIRCDDYILYDPRDEELVVLAPKCKLKENTVGEASFTILSDHPYYGQLQKLKSVFEIRQDEKPIFRGRMTGDTRDFYNRLEVDLEGVLGFTNDTLIPPFNFPEDFADAATAENVVEYFLGWILEQHNAHVEDWQKLKLGTVTVADPNNYITRSSEKYASTWETLKSKLFDSALGGYLTIRYEDDGNYVDYVDKFDLTNTQRITFGENLLDMVNESDASETYSAILPIGKDGLTIAGLADGDLNDDLVKDGPYIYSRSGVESFGWVCVPVGEATWNDVTEASNLQRKGMEYLAGTAMLLSGTITIKAVDLHFTDEEIQSFRIYRNILVDSPVHGVSGASYRLSELDIDLLNPQNTVITIGDTFRSLVDVNESKLNNAMQIVQSSTNELKEKVENADFDINVGGRNFLQKSNFADWLKEWVRWQNSSASITEDGWLQVVRGEGASNYGYYPPKISTFPFGKYRLSFDAYSDTATDLNYNYIMSDSGNSRIGSVTITNEPKRYVISFERTEELQNCSVMIGSAIGDSFYIRDIKVERGTVATDWTPAPEDLGASVDVVKQTMLEQNTTVLNDAEKIIMSALERYVETSNYEEFKQTVETQLEVIAGQITMNFTTTTEQITDVNGDLQAKFAELYKYISFSEDGITIGGSESGITLNLDNDGIKFSKNGVAFGRWDGNDFYTGNIVVEVNERAQFGNFAFIPRTDGSLAFLKVGG